MIVKPVTKYLSDNGKTYDTEAEAISHDNEDEHEFLEQYCSALKSECENELCPDCRTCWIAEQYRKYGTVMRD